MPTQTGVKDAGSAYVYSGDRLVDYPLYQKDGAHTFDYFGFSVAGIGDVGGGLDGKRDGIPDFIIGAPGADPGGHINAGSAYIYSGEPPLAPYLYQKDGTAQSDEFGRSVAGAGDVNGDGRADFIIGAPIVDPYGLGPIGSAYLYSGAPRAPLLYHVKGFSIDLYLGYSVAGTGDVNGDGRADIIIGAPYSQNFVGATEAGAAYVYSTLDTDRDGLSDYWEENGYDYDGDGEVDVDLPAMGADPLRKDIFVEIDWMQIPRGEFAHSHKPRVGALDKVIAAFDIAPVTNPDGSTGITLHLDYGQGGLFTGGNALPHDDELNPIFGEFYALKDANFAAARHPIFHYCIFAHDARLSNGHRVLGLAPSAPSSDFVVSLGLDPKYNTEDVQAGVFMHEFGHNLGLEHGGFEENPFKPNYLSVMNYSFASRGLRFTGADGKFDYSRFSPLEIPDLYEITLDETVGLNGGPAIGDYGTRFYVSKGTCGAKDVCDWNLITVDKANGPIDWNDNHDGGAQTSIPAKIDRDGNCSGGTCITAPLHKLRTFNDWEHLVFTGGLVGGALQPEDLPMETDMDEITFEIDSLICTSRGDLNNDGQYTSADVVLIMNLVFLGTGPTAGERAADLNCDGLATAADVVQALNWVFLGFPRPCCL